jgi:HlyD family secretion protein
MSQNSDPPAISGTSVNASLRADTTTQRSGKTVSRVPAVIVTLIVTGIFGLSLWYLVQPQPILIQGEAGATRIDIAARVDGRVARRPVSRGENVVAGQVLVEIDNPELLSRQREAQAALAVAQAESARTDAGTRAEIIAQKKAALESTMADLLIAQNTYDRVSALAGTGNATLQRLDEVTNSLQIAQRGSEQAKLVFEEALAGYTQEERAIAHANVAKAEASVATIRSQVDELIVKAPVAAQVYQIGTELGEFVSPGVALLSLVDLSDVWLRFDMREDFVRGLKVGDRFRMRVPALQDREISAEVRSIATKGEYSGWRATRATGDFDLRTFEVRAYPTVPIPDLRPGMSVYAQAPAGRP